MTRRSLTPVAIVITRRMTMGWIRLTVWWPPKSRSRSLTPTPRGWMVRWLMLNLRGLVCRSIHSRISRCWMPCWLLAWPSRCRGNPPELLRLLLLVV